MKYLIIGDIMIDRYVMGETNRLSQEAPIPIIDVKYQYDVLGGAANCARNIAAIAPDATVDMVGYVGEDNDGSIAMRLMDDDRINFLGWRTMEKPTIVKGRAIVKGQQIVRMDVEDKKPMVFDQSFWEVINLDTYDYIIVSDYAKGVVNKELMDYLAPYSWRMIIDPKPENWGTYPEGTLLITPNEHEYNQIITKSRPQHLLVTKGGDGMTLFYHNTDFSSGTDNIRSERVEKCEVIGAGDTVVAAIAVTLNTTGYDMLNACKVANECARWVVTQPGTSVINKDVYENILSAFRGDDF